MCSNYYYKIRVLHWMLCVGWCNNHPCKTPGGAGIKSTTLAINIMLLSILLTCSCIYTLIFQQVNKLSDVYVTFTCYCIVGESRLIISCLFKQLSVMTGCTHKVIKVQLWSNISKHLTHPCSACCIHGYIQRAGYEAATAFHPISPSSTKP